MLSPSEVAMDDLVQVVTRRAWDARVHEARAAGRIAPTWADLPPAHRQRLTSQTLETGLVQATAQALAELAAVRHVVGDVLELVDLPTGSVLRPAGDRGVVELVDDAVDGLALASGALRTAVLDVDATWFPMTVVAEA